MMSDSERLERYVSRLQDKELHLAVKDYTPFSQNNRALFEKTGDGHCVHCKRTTHFKNVKEWQDDNQTPVCGECGVDAVIPAKPEYHITPELIAVWHTYGFKKTQS